ncbi:TVP38/TMEM64 family protein [Aliivibrio sp. S4TY2]|uniref:TVP38/TMEM64 family protein n=1 Tax=unclassified Aliivibrio TaxID=2645654 RepID=UPI002378F2D2|nr:MULTISPECIES: TVP38/TMEM64 family protein [unclassified Aliivibrio]MDD9157546.1 TVP38/TMEM64 family protein [Aliivibrio sp. S4TY2]MDD9161491.1 TVP38/TMEM64 family protein [Aliivibrio sp. S4TY1]MDD9165456.1 TVP38/TMEM64 family protein [Aliivibrio sp. S4MY2]MDD9169520.1 TVP38/TMEM64 family protein [Aliivibrio sp. S4MY4]MDD9186513.1 TVP38/TMEM64 family protein [Aliivibrio sp. S4MY3]
MNKKLILLLILLASFAAVYANFGHLLTLEQVKAFHQNVQNDIQANLFVYSVVYFISYVVITALSIPGAAVVTLLGAALFGFWWSLLLVSFASTIGATIAFLSSRYLLREWVDSKFKDKLVAINEGVEKDGAFYLLTLRLIPVFPFFLINLLMGLTKISVGRFYLFSQLGMLPGTMVYLNAGTQLSEITSLSGLISPQILGSLALLGLFPIIIKFIMGQIQKRRSQVKE